MYAYEKSLNSGVEIYQACVCVEIRVSFEPHYEKTHLMNVNNKSLGQLVHLCCQNGTFIIVQKKLFLVMRSI